MAGLWIRLLGHPGFVQITYTLVQLSHWVYLKPFVIMKAVKLPISIFVVAVVRQIHLSLEWPVDVMQSNWLLNG
jgi:hypothetical protein